MNTNEGLNVDVRLVTGLQVDKSTYQQVLGAIKFRYKMKVSVFFLAREQLSSLGAFRARSFGIFRNKNIFRNIFRLFCSWEQN